MGEVIDATKDMTLDEIRDRDIDNLTLVWNASKEHVFPSVQHAMAFLGQALNKALVKLGVTALDMLAKSPNPNMLVKTFFEKQLTKQLKDKDVKVEHRTYGKQTMTMLNQAEFYDRIGQGQTAEFLRKMAKQCGDGLADAWRSGQYFYHGNEIAYFIADPIIRDRVTGSIVLPGQKEVVVVTNVPM